MPVNTPTPPDDIGDLRSLSQRLGADITLVQGSGGNTSVKNDGVLWVKASGTWLADATEKDILVPVDLPVVNSLLSSGESDFNEATLSGELRPSIETSLHCQLAHHVVVHVHSVSAIALSVQESGRERLGELLSGIDWRYVPYARPGASLTAEVNRVLGDAPGNVSLLVLENHGLVLGGESCASVEGLLAQVESLIHVPSRSTVRPSLDLLSAALSEIDGWHLPATPDIHGIALDDGAIKIAVGGVLIPDHAVFLEKKVPVCESTSDVSSTLDGYRTETGEEPDWMIIRGAGVLLSGRIGAAGEAQLRGLAMVSLKIPAGVEVRYIDERAAQDLRDWDAEKYRRKIDAELSKSTDG